MTSIAFDYHWNIMELSWNYHLIIIEWSLNSDCVISQWWLRLSSSLTYRWTINESSLNHSWLIAASWQDWNWIIIVNYHSVIIWVSWSYHYNTTASLLEPFFIYLSLNYHCITRISIAFNLKSIRTHCKQRRNQTVMVRAAAASIDLVSMAPFSHRAFHWENSLNRPIIIPLILQKTSIHQR